MADTARSQADLVALSPDNTSGLITAQTFRDAIVSAWNVVDHPDLDQQTTPLVLKAAGSQTASLLDCQTSAGSSVLTVGADGMLTVGKRAAENEIRLSGMNASWDWRITTGTNGANGVDDHTCFIGSNYNGSTGQRQDDTQAALMIGMENRYKPYPEVDYNQSEWYIQYVLPGTSPTTTGRTYMTEIRHSGTSANRITNSLWGNIAFRRTGDDALTAYYSDSGLLQIHTGRIDLTTNNSQALRQKMSTGSDDWITPFYVDNSDVVQLATASTGAVTTVNHYGRLIVGRTLDLTHASYSDSTPTLKITTAATGTAGVAKYGLLVNDPGYGGFFKVGPRGTITDNGSYVLRMDPTITAPACGAYVAQIAPTITGGNNASNHVLFDVNPTITTTTGPGDTLTLNRSYVVASGTGSYAPVVYGFHYASAVVGTSFIASQTAFHVADVYVQAGSFQTDQYGLKVEDLTGATNNYPIYTGKGIHRFGDNSASTKIGFWGATPVTRPSLPSAGVVTADDIRAALISLGLCV